ncbi:tyrosine-type recombinase/integrase [Halobellus rubicundus]|uniref:Tyrosine-type recombinase/integrase n=1 Tax=Halobellus rubicundus TaxID=2996466 RepID=A0ABD5MKC2_9EURY
MSNEKAQLAEAFGRSTDPLAEHEPIYRELDVDPFELWLDEEIRARGITEGSTNNYVVAARQFKEYMWSVHDRHPACPTIEHAKGFAEWLRESEGNNNTTVSKKMMFLTQAFRYFGNDAAFPNESDFNPFASARSKIDLTPPDKKPMPRVTEDDLRRVISGVTNIRDRAIIVMQLKLGLRSGELCNIKLEDIHIRDDELLRHYEEMGTNQHLNGRENAVYIPHDREGNKSRRPRTLPLDDELRGLLLRWLLIRHDVSEPWLFLSYTKGHQLESTVINDMWKDYWHPEYEETPRHRAVTAHFGRHHFTTFWRVQKDAPEELVKYMRGDVVSGSRNMQNSGDAIHSYIHTYYEDIEELYTNEIWKLNL